MNGQMDRLKDGWTDGWIEQIDGWMERGRVIGMEGWLDGQSYSVGWMDSWLVGWIDVWLDGWMDGQIYGCMNGQMCLCVFFFFHITPV